MAAPGDTILGTTTGDPGFYSRKIAALGDSLGGAFAAAQARRDADRKRELDEIQTFYALALKDGDLAASQGDTFKAKYRQKYPEIVPFIDVLQNRHKEVESAHAAGAKYLSTQQAIEAKYAADQQAVAALPDQVHVPVPVPSFAGGPGFVMPMPMPNPEKAARQAQLAQVQTVAFPFLAEQQLTPLERQQAHR